MIVEGFPNSRGPNPERLIEWVAAKHEVDGFQEGGEAVPAVRGALEEGATLWGGEPDDSGIRERVLAQGFSQEDLLGFYTLRSVPQWIRERKIESAHDPDVRSLIDGELENNRSRLGFPQSVLTSFDDWANWYADTNNKSFGTSFDAEETGPLANGPHGSNNVAAAISRARAAFLHSLIVEHLNMGETMMVVFGASHLLIHRPALDHALGVPCYVGVALDEARDDCID